MSYHALLLALSSFAAGSALTTSAYHWDRSSLFAVNLIAGGANAALASYWLWGVA